MNLLINKNIVSNKEELLDELFKLIEDSEVKSIKINKLKEKIPSNRNCLNCDKLFKVKRSDNIFCSKKCGVDYHYKVRNGGVK